MKDIEDVSCIQFEDRRKNRHVDYIEFKTSFDIFCASSIGRIGGNQTIFLNKHCAKIGSHLITHEVNIMFKFYESYYISLYQ